MLGCWPGATVSWPFGQLILLPGATATLQGPWDQAGDGLNLVVVVGDKATGKQKKADRGRRPLGSTEEPTSQQVLPGGLDTCLGPQVAEKKQGVILVA